MITVTKKLDNLFAQIIKSRGNKCFCCGSKENLTCGHLISRRVFAVRWDLDNAEVQCRNCNFLHQYRPEIFIAKYIQKYGAQKFLNLYEKSKSKKQVNFEEIGKKLQKILTTLKG